MTSKVHRVRFYNPKPLAVNSLAFNESENWLAISREDASIEIWDMKYSPYLIKCIPGYEKGSIEALCWVNRRLISTGMGGALVEWDLEKLTSKWSALLTGYAAWCLDVAPDNSVVAVGTEQGYLNLFRVEPDNFVYEKLFDKQEGRIICCKFNKTGDMLVTGSVATIRIWDVASGLAIHRLQAGRRGRASLVWSLAVLSDMTIVAGDSEGRITFWDGNQAQQIESFATHKADVLSLVVSSDEKTLYCSGVDPTIASFKRIEVPNRDKSSRMKWVPSVQRMVHEHDVRVLALKGRTLMSLGADGYLAVSSYPPKWLMRVPPLPPAPRLDTANTATHKLLMLRYKDHIEVWKLGRYSTNEDGKPVFAGKKNVKPPLSSAQKCTELEEDSTIDKEDLLEKFNKQSNSLVLEDKPVKLISIRAKGKRQIKCCAMSPNGRYVMYATDEACRVFNIELGDGSEEAVTLLKTPMLAPGITSCSRAVFTQDSRRLVVHAGQTLAVLGVEANVVLKQQIDFSAHVKGSLLHLLSSTTATTTYLVCAGSEGNVVVWSGVGDAQLRHHVTLPTYSYVATALAIDTDNDYLLVVHANNWINEYDLKSCQFNAWPRKMGHKWSTRRQAVTAACYHPRDSNKIILSHHTGIWILDKSSALTQNSEETSEPQPKKKPGKRKSNIKIEVIPCKYLAGLSWVSPDEAVLVEVLPENIISQLPPVLAVKKFQAA